MEEDYDDDENEDEEKPKKESNTALIVVLVLLLAAIVAVIVYIYISFFAPHSDPALTDPTDPPQTTTSQTGPTEPAQVPCTNLTVSETVITLDAIGNAWLLNVVPEPANTTDKVTYVSSDEKVASVNEAGRITAVGPGTATVTVTCGDKVITCSGTCTVATEPSTAPTTEPTTAPTTAPTEPAREWGLNREEITFSDKYPTPWTLYEGSISKKYVTFGSEDESVATFVDGVVKPVGNGNTRVYAIYNGEKITCIVHVSFKNQATNPTEPSTEATTAATTAPTTAATTAPTTGTDEVG